MSIFGRGTRIPFRMGGGESRARQIYKGLVEAQGTAYSKDEDAEVNRANMAFAIMIENAQAYQEQGANQGHVELATSKLSDWERIYQITPAPYETEGQRRNTLAAIEASNIGAYRDVLEAALSLAVGESVALRATVSQRKKFIDGGGFSVPDVFYPPLARIPNGGRLRAGLHVVRVAFYSASREVVDANIYDTIELQDGDAITVPALSYMAGQEYCMVYLSVRPGSEDTQIVKLDHDGSATVLTDYPRNQDRVGTCHYLVIVSDAVLNSKPSIAKIHKSLGPVLPADCTYDIVNTDSPFLLDTTSPPGSPLGTGAI